MIKNHLNWKFLILSKLAEAGFLRNFKNEKWEGIFERFRDSVRFQKFLIFDQNSPKLKNSDNLKIGDCYILTIGHHSFSFWLICLGQSGFLPYWTKFLLSSSWVCFWKKDKLFNLSSFFRLFQSISDHAASKYTEIDAKQLVNFIFLVF